ncbi:hypothetical protein ACKGJY_03000 [Hyunsoonleella sp. 2307UL5-6]|uniref:hypothetical protein n=1 Tax=Hyunsoonleella sp. 2307UL5-6 TaxID=3384768 RepID=UPI0039BD7DF7
MVLFFSPITFNSNTNQFYRGLNIPLIKRKKKIINFNRIVALQIIGERVSSDDGSYQSFELNLILDDTTRINVVDHGNLKNLITDAQTLSEFLKTPIWHAKSKKKIL